MSSAIALSQTAPSSVYTQSVAQVTSFVTWIESQPTPPTIGGDSVSTQAASAFNQMKSDAMAWINKVYPACLNMPNAIVSTNDQVTPTLNSLISLAQQLQSGSNPALQTDIEQAAVGLNKTVTGVQSQMTDLAGSLTSFAQVLVGDLQSLTNIKMSVEQDVYNYSSQLNFLYGELHSLENKTCPSESDINACKARIAQVQNDLNLMNQAYNEITQACSSASSAGQGLSYMAGYWSTVGADASAVTAALNRISSDPSTVLQFDLQTALQNWSQTVAIAQQTAARLMSASL